MSRRPTLLAAVVALLAALLTLPLSPTITSAEAAGPRKARIQVVTVSSPPTDARPGAAFTAVTVVKNVGKATSRAARTTYFLSADRARGGDLRFAASPRVRGLRPGQSSTTRTRLVVPPGAKDGRYHLLACVGSVCRASAGRTSVATPLRGTLSGAIVFDDREAETTESTVMSRHDQAEAKIRINVDESRDGWDVFRSAGSTYSYAGDYSQVYTTDQCVVDTKDVAAGGGRLIQDGNQYDDDLLGDIGTTDHREIRLLVGLRYEHTTTKTLTSRTEVGCIPGTTVQGPTRSRDLSDIELHQVSRTASRITYRIHEVRGPYGTATDWDEVTGTLTLTLR